jgi:hypothetical protein
MPLITFERGPVLFLRDRAGILILVGRYDHFRESKSYPATNAGKVGHTVVRRLRTAHLHVTNTPIQAHIMTAVASHPIVLR